MSDRPDSPQPAILPMAPGRLVLGHTLLIVVFCLVVLLPGLFAGARSLSHHEVLAAQPAREMLQGGNWIVQTYVGVPRYEKPPTTSWLIALSMGASGTDSAWAVRLPSIVSAIAGIVIIGHLAARWLGAAAGLIAAAIQVTTVWLQTQANLAEADIHIVTATSAAFALFAIANVEHPSGVVNTRAVRVGFMASLGVAFLFKGPHPLLFVMAGCLAYIAARRSWRQLWFFLDPVAIGVLVCIVAAWPVAALVSDPSIRHAWYAELTSRVIAAGESKSWLIYLRGIPLSLAPWVILLVPLSIGLLRGQKSLGPLGLLLLAWFVPGMLMLQIATYKSIHYAYPMLPPLSIAMAAGLVLWIRWQWSPRPAIPVWALAFITVIAGIAGGVATMLLRQKLPPASTPIVFAAAAGLLLAILFQHRRQLTASVATLLLTVGATVASLNTWVVAPMKADDAREQFAQRINATVSAGQTLYLVNFVSDDLVWHLRVPMKRVDDLKVFEGYALPDEGQLVLTRLRAIPWLQERYTVVELDRVSKPTRADLSGQLLPALVRVWADKPAYSAPSSRPPTPTATAPASQSGLLPIPRE